MSVKKFIAATLMTAALTGTAQDKVQVQLKELKDSYVKQQQELQSMRQKIQDVESVHSEAIHKYIKDEVAAEVSKNGLLSLSSHVEGLKIKGDLRLRYQNEKFGGSNSRQGRRERDRFRQRVRIGAEWKTKEGWDIGIGISTGGSDGRSTNDTFGDSGNAFETGDLRLDYAYAKHSWEVNDGDKLTLTLGQQKNPYNTSKMFFDGDLRPIGITGHYSSASGFFATAGAYTVAEVNSGREESDVMMYAIEAGYKDDNFLASLMYMHLNEQSKQRTNGGGDGGGTVGGAKFVNDDYAYNVLMANLAYKFKTGDVKWDVHGSVAYNMGVEDGAGPVPGVTEDANFAYTAGFKGSYGKFSAGYDYAHIEANSMPWFFVNSDLGTGTTNYKGHVFSAKYKLTKNLSLGATALLANTIESSGDGSQVDSVDIYQLDLVYKF